MRRLTYLAAAVAATAALSIVPLALASSASASTTPVVPTSNWAGYVAKTPANYSILDQFGWVEATFIVPQVTCSDSTVSSYSHLRPSGALYSAAAFWVGLGGAGKGTRLEQDGVQVWCPNKTTNPPLYGAFYEMVPADQSGGTSPAPLYNKAGQRITIRHGDKIVADTWDYSTQSEATSHPWAPGHVYRFQVRDLTQGAQSRIALKTFNPVLGTDNTAEVVSEAENNGPWAGRKYTGIAHFQPVAYSNIKVGMNGGGYTYGISPGPSWTAAKYYVHSGPVGGLFGTLLFSSDHTLISTGGLSKGGHAFTNYWHKF